MKVFVLIIKNLMLATTLMVVSGCTSGDISDLDLWVQEKNARPGGRIEPVPEIKAYEAYAYRGSEEGKPDPFELFYQKKAANNEKVVDVIPDHIRMEIENRNREELEEFELDSLRMVGTMDDSSVNWGIIQAPDGVVHRVKVGNYAGRNIGKIVNIFEDHIELREIVRSSDGRWEERQAALALVEQ